MTFDTAGNLYVADSVNQRMQQLTPGRQRRDLVERRDCGAPAAGAPAT